MAHALLGATGQHGADACASHLRGERPAKKDVNAIKDVNHGAQIQAQVENTNCNAAGQVMPSVQLPVAGSRDWSPTRAPHAQHGVQKYPGAVDPRVSVDRAR